MSAPRSISALTLSLALALALGACGKTEAPAAKEGGAAKGPSPVAAVMFGSGSSDQGEALFGRECAFCHVGKSTGALMLGRRLGKENADLTKRTDLEADYVKAVVRNGLVNMPPFSRVELTDAEVDAIAVYLTRNSK
ncbi:c-type cytochrome [Novosphingobium arvoryzae]|uniref:c-type cytochrome n=1 Tax=Novosphingobium arvoryzae TaxID=1256514 RepID=UPI0035AF2D98